MITREDRMANQPTERLKFSSTIGAQAIEI